MKSVTIGSDLTTLGCIQFNEDLSAILLYVYVWKILHGLVHNPGLVFKKEGPVQKRLGLKCVVPKDTGKLRESSFLVSGPNLFNSIPKDLREYGLDNTQTCEFIAKRFLCNFLHFSAIFCNENFYLQHLHFGSHNAFSDFICILKCILRGFA